MSGVQPAELGKGSHEGVMLPGCGARGTGAPRPFTRGNTIMNKILLSILLLSIILPGLAGSRDKGVLRGSVRSMETRELLDQTAIVFFHVADTVRERTIVSHSGMFVVLDMPPGTYRARVTHEGYHAFMSPSFQVKADSALSLNFFLKPFVAAGDTLGTVHIGKPGVDYKMKIVKPEPGTYR